MKGRSEAKERFWRKLIGEFDPQRGSVRSWCEANGVSEPSFYAWRRELQRREHASDAESASPPFLPLQIVAAAPTPAAVSATAEVLVLLPNGLRLQTPVSQLAAVLDVLEARAC